MTPSPNPRVTVAMLARRLGLAKSTVSEALRDHGVIALETRRRVRTLADELGYQPFLAASAAARGRYRGGGRAVNLLSLGAGQPVPLVQKLSECAGKASYAWTRATASDAGEARRLLRRARDRGCDAVCVEGAFGITGRELAEWPEWRYFAVLGVAHTPVDDEYPFDTVTVDYFREVGRCVREVKRRGYRRPGCVLYLHDTRILDDVQRLGAAQFEMGEMAEPPPIFTYTSAWSAAERARRFARWMKQARPDAVVAFSVATYWWLLDAGYQVPRDVGFAALRANIEDAPMISGVPKTLESEASLILETLTGMLALGRRGLPKRPKHLLLQPEWFEGGTLRRPG